MGPNLKNEDKNGFRIHFVGVGVGKSGTTWLADKLRQHPQVFIPPIKEIKYFNKFHNLYDQNENVRHGKSLQWYHSFFTKADKGHICGEISPAYLRNENCAKDIYKYNPAIKILVILRDPVHRSFSNYLSGCQWGILQNYTFASAIEKYPNLIKNSLYSGQLKRYFDIYPKEQIKVMFYSDLRQNCFRFYQEVLLFLGIKEWYPDHLETKSNEPKEVRLKLLSRGIASANFYINNYPKLRVLKKISRTIGFSALLSGINEKDFKEKPRLDKEIEVKLRAYFREDIEKLEVLLSKDLSSWK